MLLAGLLLGFIALSDAPSPEASPPPTTEPAKPATVAPTSATSTPDGRRRVLVLDLKSHGVDADTARTLSDIVAAAVTRDPTLAVTSGEDVRSLMTVEADRTLAGCEDGNDSCLANLAGALGADLIVSGSVGRLGALLVVSVALYDTGKQAALGREKVEATNIADLSPLLDDAVARLLGHPVVRATPAAVPLGTVLAVTAVRGVVMAGGSSLVALRSLSVQGDPRSGGADKATAAATLTPAIVVSACGLSVGVATGAAAFTVDE